MENVKNGKRIKVILAAIIVVAVAAVGIFAFHNFNKPKNCIVPAERDSEEMKTAELLSGDDEAFLFHYYTKEKFKSVTMFLSEYRKGKLISRETLADVEAESMKSASEGRIAFVPSFEKFKVNVFFTNDGAKCATDFSVLEHEKGRENYLRSSAKIDDEIPIRFDSEQGLIAFTYGKESVSGMSIEEIGGKKIEARNDYVYYVSIRFNK